MNYSNMHLKMILFLGLLFGLGIGALLGLWNKDLPRVESLSHYHPNVVTQVFDIDNRIIGEFYTERRQVLKRNEIPQHVIDSLLAAEDLDFYSHSGFDFLGILRAAIKNMASFKISQGGSTLTQQMARMLFLSNERTFNRKIKEALLTIKIERSYSKDEILTLYLNQSYFGHGAYGIESAARTFFNCSAKDLTTAQSAALMGLLKNPSYFSPINHPDRTVASRNLVLDRMCRGGFITETERDAFQSEPIGISIQSESGKVAPYFVEDVRKQLFELLGNERLLNGGFQVFTTLNSVHQQAADRAIVKGLTEFKTRHEGSGEIQAALIAITPGTGEVSAMVGGSDFAISKFNRATQAKRQAGSSIKPFIFLTALLKGFKPSDIIVDEPTTFIDPKTRKQWSPRNYDLKYRGPTTLRMALEQSNNIVTTRLLDNVGIDSAMQVMRDAGIESQLPPYLSLGLGSGEVSLIELTNAYATLAANGIRSTPHLIRSIKDENGNLIKEYLPEVKEVFDMDHCFQLTHMLRGVVDYGTGWRAKQIGRPIAAKTGTTNDYSDAWFMGYTPSLTVGVWIGYDLRRSMGHGETGSRAAGPIFTDFMMQTLSGMPVEEFEKTKEIEMSTICHESGLLAGTGCPSKIPEAFISGTVPFSTCPLHESE